MVIKISIIGTHQTGSTRVFNLIRLLYESQGKNVYSCWDYQNDKDNKYDIIVNKIHNCSITDLKKYNIKILPLRNILDSAVSANKRWPRISLYESCHNNILIFNKFKNFSDFIFVYEKYNLDYIKNFCNNILKIYPSDNSIIEVMKKLEYMHNRKDIVKKDDINCKEFRKTLYSQSHNTSGGKIDNYKTKIEPKELSKLLNDRTIYYFLKRWKYI